MSGANTMQIIITVVVLIIVIAVVWYAVKQILGWFSRRKAESSQPDDNQ